MGHNEMKKLFIKGAVGYFISGDNFFDVNPAVLISEKDGWSMQRGQSYINNKEREVGHV